MPMRFKDFEALKRYFGRSLPPKKGEDEAAYRERCAVWSEQQGDKIQAHEVRTGVGWDQWNPIQHAELLKRQVGPAKALDLMLRLSGAYLGDPDKYKEKS